MSDSYNLDDFLFAVKTSIYRANRKAWIQHLRNLQRYFRIKDKVMHPLTFPMMLPRAEVEEGRPDVEQTDVPVASLVEHTPLTMASLSMEFECYIEGLQENTEKAKKDDTEYQVVLNMSSEKRPLPKAKFTIEYKMNEEPPEGIARVNDALLKYF